MAAGGIFGDKVDVAVVAELEFLDDPRLSHTGESAQTFSSAGTGAPLDTRGGVPALPRAGGLPHNPVVLGIPLNPVALGLPPLTQGPTECASVLGLLSILKEPSV